MCGSHVLVYSDIQNPDVTFRAFVQAFFHRRNPRYRTASVTTARVTGVIIGMILTVASRIPKLID